MNTTLFAEKNEFQPNKGLLIVQVDPESKNTHKIEGTDIQLYIEKDFGFNEREKNPVNAVVVNAGSSGLTEGERVVCWHNSFKENYLVGEKEIEGSSMYGSKRKIKFYAIRSEWVYFILKDDGSVVPVGNFAIVNRIYVKPKSKSSIIILEDSEKKENNRAVIVSVSESGKFPYKKGDVVLIETMADYEVVYHDGLKEQRLIRVKDADIIGIDHSFDVTKENIRLGI